MPVLNVSDYVFGYGNVTYDSTLVLSSFFNAAIPSKLGKAHATDKPANLLQSEDGGTGVWSNAAQVEGVGGIKGFRPTYNAVGSVTEMMSDPKWKAPPKAVLTFKFFCTEPQTVILSANDTFDAEIQITASDSWQNLKVNSGQMINRYNREPLDDWGRIGKIQLKPKTGSDLTKIIFAEFKWMDGKN